ncbi:aldehyde dehydrogenase family protein [Alicyclobacillus ferrooxydans]|uniref:Aldehyde dehydrogenase n=1 Tax=Alicyclobacillus ferrooxydans TaxID=471514 RepID=A0A0P9GL06_9BACL|nr:aldehyde dehydrogenase family protein [Alicyclobacillus ferrooxydans]KPV40808.1 aldehyde dehydrogenase [Alicyclobacillus ferrooxydans]
MDSRNLIYGEWMTPSGETITVVNPSNTKDTVGVLHLSSASDMHQAGDAARHALTKWAALTGTERANYLYKTAELFVAHIDDLAQVASSEMGKPITEMKGEVMRAVNLLKYYAAEGVRANGDVIPASSSQVLQYTKRVPLGVVAIITPWNFPVAIPIWKMAPALICGNTVIWKPAEFASLTAVKVAELFQQAGLPAGVLNLVIGKGRVIGNTLLEEIEIDGVSFTGSTATGMQVAATAAKRNIRYQTEMGGKNAAVVLGDADLSLTIPAVLSGAFRSAGQKCTATSRIIVEQSIYEAFTEALQDEVQKLYISQATDPSSYLGPVASLSQHETVMKYVQMANRDARKVAEGVAKVDPALGHYVMPLVVTGVDKSHPLVTDEIFGPVATLLPAQDFDEALALCNDTVYGLSAAVFTRDIRKGLRFLDEAQAGMVRINQETAGVEYQAPFGGMKMSSSHTREQGQAALDFYSQIKTCAIYYG